MTDGAAYRLPMQTLFSRAGIPVYCASSAPVAQNPLIAALLSAMQAVLRYEPGPVLAFLKSEFSPLCEADCDTLEHYAYYWGIRGSAWEKPWQLHPCGLGQPMEPEDEAALQALNALREQAVAPLRTLRLALAKARTVDEQVRAIAALLETLDAAGRLQTQQDALEQAGQAQRAQECGQLYEALISALEQMDQVLGAASLETELFVQLFSMLLQILRSVPFPPSAMPSSLRRCPCSATAAPAFCWCSARMTDCCLRFPIPAGCLPTRSGRSSAVSAWNSVRGAARPLTAK